jgi:hypothetical protein
MSRKLEKMDNLHVGDKEEGYKTEKRDEKTGGGPPPGDLTHLEEAVIGIIGDTPIDGIPGNMNIGRGGDEPSLCDVETPGPSNEADDENGNAMKSQSGQGKHKQCGMYILQNCICSL